MNENESLLRKEFRALDPGRYGRFAARS